ncbi:MAG TPA: GNAT family N-acetyltransferase [Lacipirellulaceae bacterium]|nr:GNAT family N-acetyltransferase [Lacipirellulaceae bacterium]
MNHSESEYVPFCSEVGYGSPEYEATLALRRAVLRAPLGLDFTPEELERDRSDQHIVCQSNGQIVGCLILASLAGGDVRMRQVAVAPHAQRQGVGRTLARFAEELARESGFKRVVLHAREPAVPFYEKLGYRRVGEPFEEVALPHYEMQKRL